MEVNPSVLEVFCLFPEEARSVSQSVSQPVSHKNLVLCVVSASTWLVQLTLSKEPLYFKEKLK